MKNWLTLAAVSMLVACATANAAGQQSISADIGLAEWVPPGQVDLDLVTGSYRLRPARPRTAAAGTIMPLRTGRLAAEELRLVRDAFAAARAAGLSDPACANGGPPPRIVISNAPVPVMVLRSEDQSVAAPNRLGCWTQSAQSLHSTLQAAFGWRSQEQR